MADFDTESDALQPSGLELLRVSLDRDHDPFTRQSRARGSKDLPTVKPYAFAASRYGDAGPPSSSPSTSPLESASSAKNPVTTLPTSYTPAKSKRTHARSNSSLAADANDSNLDSNTDATSSGKSLETATLALKDIGGGFEPSDRTPRVRFRKKDPKVYVHYGGRIDPSTKLHREAVATACKSLCTRDVEADRGRRGKWSSADKIAFAVILIFLILAMPGLLMLACHTHGENPRAAKFLVSFGMIVIAFLAFLLAFFASRSPPECLLVLVVVIGLAILIRMEIDTILPFLASFWGYDLPKQPTRWCIHSS